MKEAIFKPEKFCYKVNKQDHAATEVFCFRFLGVFMGYKMKTLAKTELKDNFIFYISKFDVYQLKVRI